MSPPLLFAILSCSWARRSVNEQPRRRPHVYKLVRSGDLQTPQERGLLNRDTPEMAYFFECWCAVLL